MRAAFTLVEMLVVIAIIGILAGLLIPAVVSATGHAKEAVIVSELSQLDAACKAYQEKYGEFPPDFAGLYNTTRDPSSPSGATFQGRSAKPHPDALGQGISAVPQFR